MTNTQHGADMDSDYADAQAARWAHQAKMNRSVEYVQICRDAETRISEVASYFNGDAKSQAYAARATESANWEIAYAARMLAEIWQS